jgi:hypothetical protein
VITSLLCTITTGYGAITMSPGIVPTPRYDGARVEIILTDGTPTDIRVDGPYDRAYSYVAHGIRIQARRLGDSWLIDTRIEGEDAGRESLIIDAHGQLVWVQLANARQLRAASASVFAGRCR